MISRFVGMKRLVKLWNFLQTVPNSKFDMGFWATPEGEVELGKKYRMNGCGTSACIGGWATRVVPDLELKFYRGMFDEVEAELVGSHRTSGIEAFANSFGLEVHEGQAICDPDENNAKRPKEAARAVLRQIETMAKELGYEVLDDGK